MAEHPNAFCKACNVKFKTSNSGILQVKSHAKGVKHQDKERVRWEKTNHRVFVISSESEELTLSTSKTNLVHTNEDKLIKVETIQALDFIQSNYSFASAANDSEEFWIMFPDSKIAKSYSQGETKVKYVIQFGIALYIKELILDHIKGKPFSLLLDKTTTQQVKKQFDANLQYWSSENQISNIIWSFSSFYQGAKIKPKPPPTFGNGWTEYKFEVSAGPFEVFWWKTCCFWTLTRLLDKVCGSFKHGVKSLPNDIDQLAVDLDVFLSLKRAERGLQRNKRRHRCYCSLCP